MPFLEVLPLSLRGEYTFSAHVHHVLFADVQTRAAPYAPMSASERTTFYRVPSTMAPRRLYVKRLPEAAGE
jgi:hypothetical protein